ncbi:hypothetical protein HF086_009987 [Spodoptera exigua]|uniref:Uncharacterized protein n=1 Tax=Spodoptera exigua TaxID=7107 RepID=A0A922SL94_SPOEX|nr:hypothetical protein HF086_009987 [Spodoptera exigua]
MDVDSGFPGSDSGGGSVLSRKRFQTPQLEARVYHQATNLQPIEPPTPPPMPSDPVQVAKPKGRFIIAKILNPKKHSLQTENLRVLKSEDSNLDIRLA